MPKRMVNGERLWGSTKLAKLPDEYALAYAYLYPIALADGTFECDPEEIWATCFARRKDWSVDKVRDLLCAFLQERLLTVRKDVHGKIWGFWTGSEQELPKKAELFKLKIGKKYLFETQDFVESNSRQCQENITTGLVWFGLGRVGEGGAAKTGIEDLLSDTPSANTSKTGQTRTMKIPELVFQDIAAIWQTAVPGGLCKKPFKGWWKGFEEALQELGGNSDVLTDAFGLWVKENADHREQDPLVSFLKVRRSFIERVQTNRIEKKVVTGKEPELQAAFAAQDKKLSEFHGVRSKEERDADKQQSAELRDVI